MPNFCPPRTAALEPFTFEGTLPVRVVLGDDAEPWFSAADVCAALSHSNPSQALAQHVDPDDLTKREVIDALGRRQLANFINESGIYALVMGSTLPTAKKFKTWVTREVLPAIRRTGTYSVDPTRSAAEALLLRPSSEVLRLAAALAEENERQAKQLEAQARVIEEQRPAKEFVDRFVAAKGSVGVRQVAKRIGRKQNELVEELLRDKVLYRSAGKLTPFAEYEDRQYFVVKNGEKNGKAFGHARFTTEGIAWAAKRYGRATPEVEPTELAPSPRQGSLL